MFQIWRSGYKIAMSTVSKHTNYFPENVFAHSPLELFHELSGAISIFLQFDWLKVYLALLTRQ